MLSKILKKNHNIVSDNLNVLYFFEKGDVSEDDIAREIIPLFKKYDANGNSKLRILPDLNKLSNEVPEMLLKPLPTGKGSNIAGISIPNMLHEEFVAQLIKLGYMVK